MVMLLIKILVSLQLLNCYSTSVHSISISNSLTKRAEKLAGELSHRTIQGETQEALEKLNLVGNSEKTHFSQEIQHPEVSSNFDGPLSTLTPFEKEEYFSRFKRIVFHLRENNKTWKNMPAINEGTDPCTIFLEKFHHLMSTSTSTQKEWLFATIESYRNPADIHIPKSLRGGDFPEELENLEESQQEKLVEILEKIDSFIHSTEHPSKSINKELEDSFKNLIQTITNQSLVEAVLEAIQSLFLAQKLGEFEKDTGLYLLAWGPEQFELIQKALDKQVSHS
ncbi:hypothetical protein PGT21_023993 [Puccinia graminis f. sp. tritici]|uniref:Uncharacterized protein n=1 Tax=Puccinia graminis f. sp. tritici TaxID=56615 RepID=A0A5B0P4Z5_PUCGR|nr:hypothetical protein PGT21_023993 [Puccinia graminis f. sp. tritici]KAA1095922.1 hypothetical protein PGTUg99_035611 [Puccinia graminis f. sp. tritici]